MLGLMGGTMQINPIWNYGPYHPTAISAGSQPDWYVMWLDGLARIWPAWEITAWGYRVPAVLWPTVVFPGVMLTIVAAYPWIERRLTGDRQRHNLLQRPRDNALRTSLGAMAITFFLVMLISGGNDVIAYAFQVSLNAMIWLGRIGIVLAPPLAFAITYRICIGLQQADREVLEHGLETGIIRRLPHGEFVELHQPLGPTDDDGHQVPVPYHGTPVPKKPNELGLAGRPAPGGLFRPDPRR